MALQLGDVAPDFSAETTEGLLQFHDWMGDSWCILFSHPKNFTPVCTTELGMVAKIKPLLDRRNVKVIALSVDSLEDHHAWLHDINETQKTEVNYPLIADPERQVAKLYGMIHAKVSNNLTVRSVFIIDPHKQIRFIVTYPVSCGRNFDEILRVVDSLQLTDKYNVMTPANWVDGEDCIIPHELPSDLIDQQYPKGHREERAYLRYTPQPNL